MTKTDFWLDQERARIKSRRLSALREEVSKWQKIKKDISDLRELLNIAAKENNEEIVKEVESQIMTLEKDFLGLEFQLLFFGRYDENDAIVSIHAGAGGTEAQDWTEILARMYGRFAERKNFEVQILDESRGGEAGIKSITMRVRGRYAYGNFKSEHGVHRLVRISPFDAEKMRHTSFALVEILPELEDVSEVEIDPKDLRIDTFLSSGHGGQGVQTTYSAVRVVHLPTGITVACQNERSQQQNKEIALKILKSKLHHKYLLEQESEKKELRGEWKSAEWGNQIRSYVLQPYRLVKDHRTKFETSDTDGVLDGKIDDFVEAYLRWRAESERRS